MNKESSGADKFERKTTLLPLIRSYLAAVLLMVPATEIKSESTISPQQEVAGSIYQETPSSPENTESIESVTSYEIIFKDGIRKALKDLNTINQIPLGGKHIEYYRDEGNLKGKKLQSESVQILKFPEKFDISPRVITSPVASMVVHLGDRKFSITPDIGKIKKIYLTSGELVIETTLFFDIAYDKQIKLPNLLLKLWMTPGGKGEKNGFIGTSVVEL